QHVSWFPGAGSTREVTLPDGSKETRFYARGSMFLAVVKGETVFGEPFDLGVHRFFLPETLKQGPVNLCINGSGGHQVSRSVMAQGASLMDLASWNWCAAVAGINRFRGSAGSIVYAVRASLGLRETPQLDATGQPIPNTDVFDPPTVAQSLLTTGVA